MARPANYCVSCPFGGGPVVVVEVAPTMDPDVTYGVHKRRCETLTDVDDFLEELQEDPSRDSAPMPLGGWPNPFVSRHGMRELVGWYGDKPVTRLKPEVAIAVEDTISKWCDA